MFNEQNNVARFAEAISGVFSPLEEVFELVMVDDGSTDGTWDAIQQLAESYPVAGVRFSRNFGKEAAIIAGLESAGGRAVVVMDGDLQHPPELIPEMLRLWREEGVEVVEAVKSDRGREAAAYRTGSSLFYFIMNTLSGFDLANASDFKLLTRQAAEALLGMQERNPFFRGMTAWVGFKRARVPFEVKEREEGGTKWSFLRLLRLSLDAITGFSSLPLHAVTLLGLCFLAFSVVLGINTLYMKFSGQAVSGFTTVILLQLIIGSMLMISLGIIGEYLARIFAEVKKRPRFLVSERVTASTRSHLPEA